MSIFSSASMSLLTLFLMPYQFNILGRIRRKTLVDDTAHFSLIFQRKNCAIEMLFFVYDWVRYHLRHGTRLDVSAMCTCKNGCNTTLYLIRLTIKQVAILTFRNTTQSHVHYHCICILVIY